MESWKPSKNHKIDTGRTVNGGGLLGVLLNIPILDLGPIVSTSQPRQPNTPISSRADLASSSLKLAGLAQPTNNSIDLEPSLSQTRETTTSIFDKAHLRNSSFSLALASSHLDPHDPIFNIWSKNNIPVPKTSTAPETPVTIVTGNHKDEIPSTKKWFYCRNENCDSRFSHLKDLLRHGRTVHSDEKPFFCPEPDCARSHRDNGFSRRDNLRKHMNSVHDKVIDDWTITQNPIEHRMAAENGGSPDHDPRISHEKTAESPEDLLIADIHASISAEQTRPINDDTAILGLQSLDHLYTFNESEGSPAQNLANLRDISNTRKQNTASYLAHQSIEGQPVSFSKPEGKVDRKALFEKHQKFRSKALEAYQKLLAAAPDQSEAFQNFVTSLKDLNHIIQRGYAALFNFANQNKKLLPDDLESLYCMLHVCYAMSQATEREISDITDVDFANSATEWKQCLPKVSNSGVQEQDLFQELIDVMWDELKIAVDFAETLDQADIFGPDFQDLNPAYGNFDFDFDTDDPSSHTNANMPLPKGTASYGVQNPDGTTLNDDFDWTSFLEPDPWLMSAATCHGLESVASTSTAGLSLDIACQPLWETHVNTACPPMWQEFTNTACPHPPGRPDSYPPQWDTLVKTLVITVAFTFVREMKDTSFLFRYMCSKIITSTFYDDRYDQITRAPDKSIDPQERQHIVAFLEDSLPHKLSPILNATSNHFLKGTIATLPDLEECMIAFLTICSGNAHMFLCFSSDITSRVYAYYHSHYPMHLKSAGDIYNSPTYVSDRRRAEEQSFIAVSSGPEHIPSSFSMSLRRSSITSTCKRKFSEPDDLPVGKKPKLQNDLPPAIENCTILKWRKNIVGKPPKKRYAPRKVPHAPA